MLISGFVALVNICKVDVEKTLIKKNYNCNFLIPYLPCQDQRIYQKATINLI